MDEEPLITCVPVNLTPENLEFEGGVFVDWFALEVIFTSNGITHKPLDIRLFKGTRPQACFLASVLVKAYIHAWRKGTLCEPS